MLWLTRVFCGQAAPAAPSAATTNPPPGIIRSSLSAEQRDGGSLKRTAKVEDVYFLDATKEGNASRFLNVSFQNKSLKSSSFSVTEQEVFDL